MDREQNGVFLVLVFPPARPGLGKNRPVSTYHICNTASTFYHHYTQSQGTGGEVQANIISESLTVVPPAQSALITNSIFPCQGTFHISTAFR